MCHLSESSLLLHVNKTFSHLYDICAGFSYLSCAIVGHSVMSSYSDGSWLEICLKHHIEDLQRVVIHRSRHRIAVSDIVYYVTLCPERACSSVALQITE